MERKELHLVVTYRWYDEWLNGDKNEEYRKMTSRYMKIFGNLDLSKGCDLDRIYTLRDMGYWAYVMIYDKPNCRQIYRDMQRWCNNRIIFAKCENFEDYKRNL